MSHGGESTAYTCREGSDMNMEHFPLLLQLLRRSKGLSLKEMAFATGHDPSLFSLYENGKRNVSLKKLSEMAVVLGKTEIEILTLVESLSKDGVIIKASDSGFTIEAAEIEGRS